MQQLTHKQLLAALHQLIKQENISQQELADKTGFTQGNISRMLHAKYAPGLDQFMILCNAAGISLSEIEDLAFSLAEAARPAP